MENHQSRVTPFLGRQRFPESRTRRHAAQCGAVSACWRARSRSQDYLRFVESKLPLIPRYLKRVVSAPFNIGLPSWDYDPEFDLRNHVREVTLKHGTDRN